MSPLSEGVSLPPAGKANFRDLDLPVAVETGVGVFLPPLSRGDRKVPPPVRRRFLGAGGKANFRDLDLPVAVETGVGVFLPPLSRGDRKVPPPVRRRFLAAGGKANFRDLDLPVAVETGVGVFLPPLSRGDRKVPPPRPGRSEVSLALGERRISGGDTRVRRDGLATPCCGCLYSHGRGRRAPTWPKVDFLSPETGVRISGYLDLPVAVEIGVGVFLPPLPRGDRDVSSPIRRWRRRCPGAPAVPTPGP